MIMSMCNTNITKNNNCGRQKHETGKRKYSNPLSMKIKKKNNEKCYGTWYANIGSSRCTLTQEKLWSKFLMGYKV